jgi:flagellar basal-body rod modification protein FlgD
MTSVTNVSTNGTPPTTSTTPNSMMSIGKDQFLKLLVTQLKNQDPMSPMQPNEFAAQLAQFSSVEQLIQLNDSMTNQSAAVQMSTLAGQASLGASLIGRQVVAEGNDVVIPPDGKAGIRIDIGGIGGAATLTLKDAKGAVVATRDLGALPAGHQTVALPTDLPPGSYTYAVTVKGSQDASVSVMTYTTGVVDAVQFDNNQILLRLGGLKVPLGNVAEIDPAP